jgi:hypothetical protein
MLFVFICLYWCPTRFPYQMTYMLFKSSTKGGTSGAGNVSFSQANDFIPIFCAQSQLSFCPFSFGHCIICSSLIYSFWLPLWYHQTFLNEKVCTHVRWKPPFLKQMTSFPFFVLNLNCLFVLFLLAIALSVL